MCADIARWRKIYVVISFKSLEHRAGIEPANTGFADQRVSHFATGAHPAAGVDDF